MPADNEANHDEEHPGPVVHGKFVGALGDAPELLQVPHYAFDEVALAIAAAVEAPPRQSALVVAPWQRGRDALRSGREQGIGVHPEV